MKPSSLCGLSWDHPHVLGAAEEIDNDGIHYEAAGFLRGSRIGNLPNSFCAQIQSLTVIQDVHIFCLGTEAPRHSASIVFYSRCMHDKHMLSACLLVICEASSVFASSRHICHL